MRSSGVVRASGCKCQSCYSPGFDLSILRHSWIWGAEDESDEFGRKIAEIFDRTYEYNEQAEDIWEEKLKEIQPKKVLVTSTCNFFASSPHTVSTNIQTYFSFANLAPNMN